MKRRRGSSAGRKPNAQKSLMGLFFFAVFVIAAGNCGRLGFMGDGIIIGMVSDFLTVITVISVDLCDSGRGLR